MPKVKPFRVKFYLDEVFIKKEEYDKYIQAFDAIKKWVMNESENNDYQAMMYSYDRMIADYTADAYFRKLSSSLVSEML